METNVTIIDTALVLSADDYGLLTSHGYKGLERLTEMKRLLPYIDTMTIDSDTHWVRVMERDLADLMDGEGNPLSEELSQVWAILNELHSLYGENAVQTTLTKKDTYRMMLAVSPALDPSELQHIADLVELVNM